MSVDLSQFYQVFYEESAEHLAEMERILLSVVPLAPDEEDLNAVFRAAHSIKGGAGTFGFPDMAQVTHSLETLLDRVRHHELNLTGEMVNAFLQTKDAIAMLLAGHRDKAEVDEAFVESTCRKLRSIQLEEDETETTAPGAMALALVGATEPESNYHIIFSPPSDLFRRGVRLEPLFAELRDLGELAVTAQIEAPKDFGIFEPECCYLNWDMTLRSRTPLEEIREIFMFVADEDEIRIQQLEEGPLPSATDNSPSAPITCSEGDKVAMESATTESDKQNCGKDGNGQNNFNRRTTDSVESSSIRVGVSKVDQLINQMGELVITQAMLAQTAQQFDPVIHEDLHRCMELLQRNTRDLQESVMSIRMMPISFIFSRFPRLVHDLAPRLGKQVEIRLEGETIELDKGLIEKLADPLTHLVRNSLDHGIEQPDARIAIGKAPCGVITLKASQQGGRVVVEVADDGAGLNRKKILAKAAQNGLAVSDAMSDDEVWQLIFAPGFSTADQVTDVSGRGVGMDVVLKNVTAMGGRTTVFSRQDKGSRVMISLPLTLAILDGLSIRVGGEIFIVPLNSIIESLQPLPADLNEVGRGNTTVRVRGDYIPLLRLGDIFSIAGAVQRPEEAVVMLVEAEGEQVALLVDELLGQHQVVIKNLETNYRKVDGTAGATILGDGRVALILDAVDIVRLWRSG